MRGSLCALLALLLLDCAGWTQGAKGGGAGGRAGQASRDAPLPAEVLAREGLSVVLGRPTDRSVALNLLGNREQEVYVEYGTVKGAYGNRTAQMRLAAGKPAETVLDGLQPDHDVYYRLQTRSPGASSYAPGPEGRARTQRAPGTSFSFEIIGDSHPERPQQFDPTLYAQTLRHAAEDSPDFFMTIGDDFSVDTLQNATKDAVEEVYRRERLYLSLVGSVAPVFLVNGNHEQASMANLDGTADNVAVWAQTSRNASFPQPAPDGFYTGDAAPVEHVGLLRDYYAWTWGDALFVVLDPYWHSPEPVDNVLGGGDKTRDLWKTTLGKEQYDWFRKTLEGSRAAYKFVFAHHVSGTGRGGIERAPYFEWGGKSAQGRDEFAANRPGWELPIHRLMAGNHVTAFVQGHDHIFANQVLDGVAYITLPEPADPNYALYNRDAFRSGDTLPNSGRVRFTVDPARVVVEYFREWLPADRPAVPGQAAQPAYRFEIPAGGQPTAGVFAESRVETFAPKGEDGKAAGKRATGGSASASRPAAGSTAVEPSIPVGPSGDLHAGTLLEFPGGTSVGLATAFLKDVEYQYRYGTDPERLDLSTPVRRAAAGTVARDRIDGLRPGGTYHFRLAYAEAGAGEFTLAPPGRFATRKAPGEAFTFVVEADPHLDENSSGPVYAATLGRMAGDAPDFLIDLGDTSMAEKLAADGDAFLARDRLVRSYWDDIGSSVPFLMVLGNHDGEHGWSAGKGKPPAAEAAALRRTWLIDPRTAPADTFDVFSDTAYGFQWGDALFVVLDPYEAEAAKPSDGWSWTLGKEQYDWLAGVLARSKAAYRFVFIHNLLGGSGKDARGGADWADRYEWGGLGADGKNEFGAKRPGWPMPLHQLFLANHVDAVFHGHDHFYAMEERDGIIYQMAPQPSLAKEQRLGLEQIGEYGYSRGVFLPSPGYLRLSVSPERTLVQYVRSGDGTVAHEYVIPP